MSRFTVQLSAPNKGAADSVRVVTVHARDAKDAVWRAFDVLDDTDDYRFDEVCSTLVKEV